MKRFVMGLMLLLALPAVANANGGFERIVVRQRAPLVARQRVIVRQPLIARQRIIVPRERIVVARQRVVVAAQPIYASAIVAAPVCAQPIYAAPLVQSYSYYSQPEAIQLPVESGCAGGCAEFFSY